MCWGISLIPGECIVRPSRLRFTTFGRRLRRTEKLVSPDPNELFKFIILDSDYES